MKNQSQNYNLIFCLKQLSSVELASDKIFVLVGKKIYIISLKL